MQEMTLVEVEQVNGGIAPLIVLGAVIIYVGYLQLKDYVDHL